MLERQVINGSGSSGQVTGLLGVSGITANTDRDDDPRDRRSCRLQAHQRHRDRIRQPDRRARDASEAPTVPDERSRRIDDGRLGRSSVLAADDRDWRDADDARRRDRGRDPLVLAESPVFISPPRFQEIVERSSANLQVVIQATAYIALVGAHSLVRSAS